MLKILVLQTHYNLSDDQMEYQIHDRHSFRQFLGLELGDTIPDAKTIWFFRNDLAQNGLVERLFDKFGQQLADQVFRSQEGQILDASIIPVPKQWNRRDVILHQGTYLGAGVLARVITTNYANFYAASSVSEKIRR